MPITIHKANILNDAQVDQLLSEVRPTHLLHTAWIVKPGVALVHTENLLWVEKTLRLVRQFEQCGGKNLVITGSSYEYDVEYGYCSEDKTPCSPATLYGAGKYALKLLLEKYCGNQKINFAWARLFDLFGPRENLHRLVPAVVTALLHGQTARCSQGLQIRDYMYIQDAADALATLLEKGSEGTFNVCSGRAISVRELVSSIADKLKATDRVEFGALPTRPDEVPLIVGDPRKLTNTTGWQPEHDFDAAITHTIDWWRNQLTTGAVNK